MIQLRVPEAFSYIWDVVRLCNEGKRIPIDEFNLIGGRISGKTTSEAIQYIALALTVSKDIGFIAFRDMEKGADDMLEDIERILDAYEVPYVTKKGKRTITVNNNTIRFVGLNSNVKNKSAKRAGLPRFGNVKYAFIWFEERFEFNEADVRSAIEAVRSIGNKDTQYIVINTCNPWAKASPYIQYASSIQSWNVKQLKETGSQIGIYTIDLGDGYSKRVLMHYSNWRANKEFITDSSVAKILETHRIDPKRAPIVDYGLPGYEEGSIYTHLLDKIQPAIYQEHEYLIGGGDYGWGRDASAGETSFIFAGASIEEGVDIYGQYVWHNNIRAKEPDVVANEVVAFYVEQMRKYMAHNYLNHPPNLRVRVDLSNIAFIQILNNVARKNHINWLTFMKCRKLPITDRIEVTLSLMGRMKLRMAPSVVRLKEEMELSRYAEVETQKREKKNDHSLNAFEYAIEPLMNKFIKEHDLRYVNMKKWKVH